MMALLLVHFNQTSEKIEAKTRIRRARHTRHAGTRRSVQQIACLLAASVVQAGMDEMVCGSRIRACAAKRCSSKMRIVRLGD
jgi:hypothetical protein